MRENVKKFLGDEFRADKISHPVVLYELSRSKLPKSERNEQSIYYEAGLFIGAGFETAGFSLTVATYHVLANPHIRFKLRHEITTVWPKDDAIPSWATLEKLPYLHAVIQEGLRMSVGVTGRLSRVNNQANMQYQDWEIPKGTPIGMSQPLTLFNPEIFPEPWTFDPERWMKGDESRELERYNVTFSGGARGCIAQK